MLCHPFNPKDIGRYLLAAERFERAGRERGDRSGPLGAVALEVLRELVRLIDYCIRASFPWLRHVFADGGYAGDKLQTALKGKGDWTLEIIKRSDAAKGFVL